MRLRQRLLAVGGLATAALFVTALSTAGTAAAAPAPAAAHPDAVHSQAALSPAVAAAAKGTSVAAREQALAAYWTSARMEAAKPDSQLPAVRAAATAKPAATAQTTAAGPAGHVAPAAPVTTPKAVTSTKAASTPAVTPAYTFPNYPVGAPVARTYGKVFFTNAGTDYVCSATIVNTAGKSEVWTAGHCVSDGGTWNYNWTFVPNYYSGVAPYGYWYAYQLWTTTNWFNNNSDFADDVGSAVMYENYGYRIADYFGAQGIAWNYPIGYYAYAFGYPQASPFTGCCLVEEQGYQYDNGDGTIYMVNYMTGGSSGGGWLIGFDGNWGYLNGHNDFKYTAYPQYMFSPYYGNQVANLYASVNNIST